MECKECRKDFDSYRALNGHQRVHGESKGLLLKRRKKKETKDCLFCGNNVPLHKKFCNCKFSANWIWVNKTKPKIIEGKINIGSTALKRFLVERDGYFCLECGVDKWRDKNISLDIDHIDGDRTNNMPNNLRFLCPNCHRQTETWGNKKGDGPDGKAMR